MVLLELKNVCKYFRLRRDKFLTKPGILKAVENVNLFIKPGETVGLVGESGSGKSTISKMITKLMPPTKGAIFFNETNINVLSQKDKRAFRKKIQIVFQNPYDSLDPRQTVYIILKEAIDIHFPKLADKDKDEKIKQALVDVALPEESLDKYPHEFSGGERQRIAIARSLSVEPELLILDEPVSSLDLSVQSQIINLLINLQKKHSITYLFISHDLHIVRFLCNRLYVMENGYIVEEGETERIFTKPLHSYTKKLLNALMTVPFSG